MRMLFLAISGLIFCTTSLFAQSVEDCDWRARADAIMEPWEENTRTFSNGRVRIAALDTTEPAAGALHVLVVSPPFDELGTRQCKVISLDGSIGFAGLDFSTLNARYDPLTGLDFNLVVGLYDFDSGSSVSTNLNFQLNQATGEIIAALGSDTE
ncbi:hypothetical protein [Cochlodiniinecator piscidefendens]|uniref:hypothetical protein n=1 Tax=Cochlodiniinecator piscidefendens TaxID=2715756 RepID=UPI001E5FEC13|nr:hypothetical protein [Cochlodiniinecator piscidefendens]